MGMCGMEWIERILECRQKCTLLVYHSLVTSGKIGGLSKTTINFLHSIVLSEPIFKLYDPPFTSMSVAVRILYLFGKCTQLLGTSECMKSLVVA